MILANRRKPQGIAAPTFASRRTRLEGRAWVHGLYSAVSHLTIVWVSALTEAETPSKRYEPC